MIILGKCAKKMDMLKYIIDNLFYKAYLLLICFVF